MKKRLKAQISIELIVVVGIVLLLFTPLLVTVYFKGLEMGERLAVAQSRLAVTRIASLTNAIGNLGENASAIIDVFVPNNMDSIAFANAGGATGAEVIITINTSEGKNEITEPVAFKFAGGGKNFSGLSQGWMRLNISSDGSEMTVNKVG